MYRKIELHSQVNLEQIYINSKNKTIFIEELQECRAFGKAYKGIFFYDLELMKTSNNSFFMPANLVTLHNSIGECLFYGYFESDETDSWLYIRKFHCENFSDMEVKRIKLQDQSNLPSIKLYNLDSRYLYIVFKKAIFLIDSENKIIYEIGEQYWSLFNSVLYEFTFNEVEHLFIQHGIYTWEDKRNQYEMRGNGFTYLEDSIYIISVPELIKSIVENRPLSFEKVSSCDWDCGYASVGMSYQNGVFIFQKNNFITNKTKIEYFSLVERKIIKEEEFNELLEYVYRDKEGVYVKRQLDCFVQLENLYTGEKSPLIDSQENIYFKNGDFILTSNYHWEDNFTLFNYNYNHQKECIGNGKQFFIDVKHKRIYLVND